MNHVYMSLNITLYRHNHRYDCTLWEQIDDGEMTCRRLTLAEAQRMQWELVKAGATRSFRPNYFKSGISTVDVDYWARH